jgi:hypothetical protein
MKNVQEIIDYLSDIAETGQVIPPDVYVRCAERVNVLLQPEQDKLFLLEQNVAKKRAELVMNGQTAAYAKIVIEASDEYTEARKQKALVERALEVIKLAKKHAQLVGDMARSGM